MTNMIEHRSDVTRTVVSEMESLDGVEVTKVRERTGRVSFNLSDDAMSARKIQGLAPDGWIANPVLTTTEYKNLYVQRDP